ncbi:hypothetical protein ACO0RG_000234 [Hanseniaspora osmophila]
MKQEILAHCYHIVETYLSISTNVTSELPIIHETQQRIQETKSVFLERILPFWNPVLNNISISYNGGKDCQVLLIIYLACLYEFFQNRFSMQQAYLDNFQVNGVYIKQYETFHILENFVLNSAQYYDLNMYTTQVGQNMKDSLREYLGHLNLKDYNQTREDENERDWDLDGVEMGNLQKIKSTHERQEIQKDHHGVIIGIRRSDPYALDLKEIQRTDADWPCFTRLQPLLEWKLQNVWSFLLFSNDSFCKLYELGYTSIGGIKTTLKNPKLNKKDNKNLWNHFHWELEHAYVTETHDTHAPFLEVYKQEDTLVQSDIDHDLVCNDTSYYPGWYLISDKQERDGRI